MALRKEFKISCLLTRALTFLFTFASMIVHHPVLDNILSGAFVMMEGEA